MTAQSTDTSPSIKATIKATVERQFSQVADYYRTSSVHATGEDLAQLVAAARLAGNELVLDAGSGAGHTALAFAPYVAHVTSVDLAEAMLAQGQRLATERGLTNLTFRLGDVEALPFAAASFDRIVSRYSAHHWPHPKAALAGFRQFLRPGGCFLLADIVSYDDFALDTTLQALEVLRDPSHVRDHAVAGWLAMLAAAGFQAEVVFQWPVRLDFDSWVQRMATPQATIDTIRWLLTGAPAEVRTTLQVEADDSFTLQGALIRAW